MINVISNTWWISSIDWVGTTLTCQEFLYDVVSPIITWLGLKNPYSGGVQNVNKIRTIMACCRINNNIKHWIHQTWTAGMHSDGHIGRLTSLALILEAGLSSALSTADGEWFPWPMIPWVWMNENIQISSHSVFNSIMSQGWPLIEHTTIQLMRNQSKWCNLTLRMPFRTIVRFLVVLWVPNARLCVYK